MIVDRKESWPMTLDTYHAVVFKVDGEVVGDEIGFQGCLFLIG